MVAMATIIFKHRNKFSHGNDGHQTKEQIGYVAIVTIVMKQREEHVDMVTIVFKQKNRPAWHGYDCLQAKRRLGYICLQTKEYRHIYPTLRWLRFSSNRRTRGVMATIVFKQREQHVDMITVVFKQNA